METKSSKSKKRGRSRVCAVINCSNGDYKLSKWREEMCEKHHDQLHETCGCEPPFNLFTFPTKKSRPCDREKWKQLVNRVKPDKSAWTPGKQSRVCSIHFKDREPTEENPLPTEDLGYKSDRIKTKLCKKPRRRLQYKQSEKITSTPSKNKTSSLFQVNDVSVIEHSNIEEETTEAGIGSSNIDETTPEPLQKMPRMDQYYQSEYVNVNDLSPMYIFDSFTCSGNQKPLYIIPTIIIDMVITIALLLSFTVTVFATLSAEIVKLNTIISALNKELSHCRKLNYNLNQKLLKQKRKCTCNYYQPLYQKLLTNDDNVKFYTGFPNKDCFNNCYDVVKDYVRRRWAGAKHTKTVLQRKFSKTPKRMGRSRVLDGKDEFLLCLMRLRLGLLGKDLQHRFNISAALCSKIFSSWLRASAKTIGTAVFIPDQEVLNATKPPHFKPIKNLHSIIDGTEIFIETPKDPRVQKLTWSNYKNHNTVKILVACSANSSIVFVSKAWSGNISDKKLTLESGYLDKVERYTTLMSDKGFPIGNECAARHINFVVPPGKNGQSFGSSHPHSTRELVCEA